MRFRGVAQSICRSATLCRSFLQALSDRRTKRHRGWPFLVPFVGSPLVCSLLVHRYCAWKRSTFTVTWCSSGPCLARQEALEVPRPAPLILNQPHWPITMRRMTMRELRRPFLSQRQCSTKKSGTCFFWGSAGNSSPRKTVSGVLSAGEFSRVPTRVLHRIFSLACGRLRFVV